MTADFLAGFQAGALSMASLILLSVVVFAAAKHWWIRRNARPRWMTELSADDARRRNWIDELKVMR